MAYRTCPRCKERFDELDDMRFRSGDFVDDDGESFDTLCEDCHRQVVR